MTPRQNSMAQLRGSRPPGSVPACCLWLPSLSASFLAPELSRALLGLTLSWAALGEPGTRPGWAGRGLQDPAASNGGPSCKDPGGCGPSVALEYVSTSFSGFQLTHVISGV